MAGRSTPRRASKAKTPTTRARTEPRQSPRRGPQSQSPRPGPQSQPSRGAERRTSLAQVGGPARIEGDPVAGEILARALGAAKAQLPWTHGFHSYPARMDPLVAREVVTTWLRPKQVLVDPFCGAGTTVLEAMASGAAGFGVDLNPLALRIAAVRCRVTRAPERNAFVERVHAVAEDTLDGVRARVQVLAPLPPDEVRRYQPHVLRELAVLHQRIAQEPDDADREAMWMVFSALVVKFSRQGGDTGEQEIEKRLGKGVPTRFFARKAEELARGWAELATALPKNVLTPRWVLGDARHLAKLLGKSVRADLILSSPPYGGTYDYAAHHARRWAWLGIDGRGLLKGEIGARRRLSDREDGAALWNKELGEALAAMARSLAPEGRCVLLMGDAQVAGRRIPAPEQLDLLAPDVGLELIAVASQSRIDWQGGPMRGEHLMLLRGASRRHGTKRG